MEQQEHQRACGGPVQGIAYSPQIALCHAAMGLKPTSVVRPRGVKTHDVQTGPLVNSDPTVAIHHFQHQAITTQAIMIPWDHGQPTLVLETPENLFKERPLAQPTSMRDVTGYDHMVDAPTV